jgi:hypothetical protein
MRRLAVIAMALAIPAALFSLSEPGSGGRSDAVPGQAGRDQTAAPPFLDDDPAPFLGMGLEEAIGRLGAPAAVQAIRGGEQWQDDVAFVYAPGYTLFWFGERLWQLRFVFPYAGSLYGLFLGDSSEKIYSLLGAPFEREGDALVYRLPYRGYPVRLRLLLSEGRLADAYLYRADF